MKSEILYEDGHILVVYKPAGLATQTARVGQQDLVSELKCRLSQAQMYSGPEVGGKAFAPYLGIVHRLDQPVEGLLLFAKNKKAAAALSGQMQGQGEAGTLLKHYYGVFCGEPSKPEGELVDYLYKDRENRAVVLEMSQNRQMYDGAKKAVLQYRVLQSREVGGRKLALADICLSTGRFHQIRAQMAHGGMSLLGDFKYGDETAREAAGELEIRNVALCAYSLEFLHPVSEKELCFRITPKGRAFSLFSI